MMLRIFIFIILFSSIPFVLIIASINSASITIFTESGATIKLDGEVVGIVKEGKITLNVEEGSHSISISKPGYKTETLDVDVRGETKISIKLKALGMLEIKSNPSARVEINGEFYGVTPLSLKLPEGEYRITISSDGYVPIEKNIKIEGFKTYIMDEELVKMGTLKLKTIPSSAKVEMNGEYIGTTPISTSLQPGEYTLKITHPETFDKILKISIGKEPKELTVKLDYFGNLIISGNPEGAKITLDKTISCVSPCKIDRIKLGDHRLTVEREGYERIERTVHIERGKNEFKYSLNMIILDLTVESSPNTAMVSIDGKFIGFTPFSTNISYGFHRIYVKKDEYEWEWYGKIVKDSQFFIDFSADSTLKLYSKQDGTFVMMKNKLIPLPVTLNLRNGVYSFTFIHKNYGKRIRHFLLEPGKIHEYTVNMVGEAYLNVVTLPNLSNVELIMSDGSKLDLGNSPLIMKKVNINGKKLILKWKNREKSLKMNIKDEDVIFVDEVLKGDVELHIVTFPSGVSIYLNGSYAGNSPLTVKIPSGIYDMKLAKEGFEEENIKLDLRFDRTRYFVWFMKRK